MKKNKLNVFEIAEELFGPMRSSTDEELELEREMIERNSKPVGINTFDLFDKELPNDDQDRSQGTSQYDH